MKTTSTLLLIGTALAVNIVAVAQPISLETAPPVVIKTIPIAGATDVDPALAEIKVTYSKAMQDGSWSWSTWGQENYPETTGQPRYLGDARTCVLPVKLQPNKFYAIWLNSEKFKNFKDTGSRSAVPYLLAFFTGAGGAGTAVIEREVNKAVSEFPAGEDLSTPEGACVAWQRANARKDAQAVSRLSLVPIDAKEQDNWYRREEQRDAAGLAVYLKALADSKIVTVQTWRGELANVIAFLPFPEGKGRNPYSSRSFGLINGAWKNLGEDRLSDLASARTGFERKKEALWQQYQSLKAKSVATAEKPKDDVAADRLLNDDQRAVLAWTDRQFRSYFDGRTFDGWSDQERGELEAKCNDALKGPRSQEYYRAIGTLAALRSTKAVPALGGIAFERVDRNNRDRWMAIRALGLIGDKSAVPGLIQLVYHGNLNTRWWAQISLVRITGKNFGMDWNAWGRWWNDQKGEPPYDPEIIRWWDGQAEPDKLAQSLDESDRKFLADIRGKSAAAATTPIDRADLVARIGAVEPTMSGIRENWTAVMAALDSGDNAGALASANRLAPHIQDFLDKVRDTPLAAGTAQALELLKTLTAALEKGDQSGVESARSAMVALGQKMEAQIKTLTDSPRADDPFAHCRLASFGGEQSEGKQSYGGRGPAIRFKPAEAALGIRASESIRLKGVRLYASRYGGGYTPEETTLRVTVRDGQDATLLETRFAYAKFGFEPKWVDLVFEQPVNIAKADEPITIAFDPEAMQTKGIYYHYQKNPSTSHSLAGTVSSGFKETPDREWMMRVAFE